VRRSVDQELNSTVIYEQPADNGGTGTKPQVGGGDSTVTGVGRRGGAQTDMPRGGEFEATSWREAKNSRRAGSLARESVSARKTLTSGEGRVGSHRRGTGPFRTGRSHRTVSSHEGPDDVGPRALPATPVGFSGSGGSTGANGSGGAPLERWEMNEYDKHTPARGRVAVGQSGTEGREEAGIG